MSDWQEITLGEICSIEIGGTPSRSEERYWWKSDNDGTRLPWVSISDMKAKVITDTKESITEIGALQSNCKHVPKGTLLMSFKLCIGKLAFAGRDLYTNEAISAIRPTRDVLPEFLYYGLQHWNLTGDSDQAVKGVTLNKQKLQEIPCLLPPLPEQKKIAEILSGIDELIIATQKRIDKIRVAHEGLANSWQESDSLEAEEGAIGDLIASIDSGWSPACEEVPPKPGEWGVLKVSAVTKGYFCEEESKRLPLDLEPRNELQIKKGDLLITRANGNLELVGKGAIVTDEPNARLIMSDKILRLNPRTDCDRDFLLLLLNSRRVRQQIETAVGGSTGAKNIGQGLLRQITVSIPAARSQAKIGNLSRTLSATLVSCKKKLNYLMSLKKGLSSALLSGRKRVSV